MRCRLAEIVIFRAVNPVYFAIFLLILPLSSSRFCLYPYNAYIIIPTASHSRKYTEDVFRVFSENAMSIPQIIIPIIGSHGHNGTLNGLGTSGAVFLNINTARQIITKDVNVPKLHSAAEMFKSINNPHNITIAPDIHVITCGVLYFLCINLHDFGKNLSRLIAYKILVVPS